MTSSYDYIVVGSGSAGGVLAARLSENGRYAVLCVEAGTRTETYFWSRPPAGAAKMVSDPEVNWCETAETGDDLKNRELFVARGKILGGTSAINGVIFHRGQREDYDAWAEAGCRGWAYDDVLPYFKKLESTSIGKDAHRGRHGPIRVTFAPKTSPLFDLVIEAAKAVGYEENPDYVGETPGGVSMAQLTVHRGLRESTATRYLAPARKRANLTILTGAEVASLILEGTRCVGIRYRRDGAMAEARATREVILCAGVIGSPKILELSGIGNPEILGRHGIPVVKALPGVGERFRDHFLYQMRWTLKRKGLSLSDRRGGWRLWREVLRYLVFRKGFISHGMTTLRIFAKSDPAMTRPNITLMFNPFQTVVVNGEPAISPVDGFFAFAQPQRPESTGSVHIRSADPFVQPTIRYSQLATAQDRATCIAAVRRAREVAAAEPLASAIAEETHPGPDVQSDAEILESLRSTGTMNWHFVGTCKMGHDEAAVVDDRLRVHGLEGLRVADASIMPMIISGNPSIPCMMIAEKCADMILQDAQA